MQILTIVQITDLHFGGYEEGVYPPVRVKANAATIANLAGVPWQHMLAPHDVTAASQLAVTLEAFSQGPVVTAGPRRLLVTGNMTANGLQTEFQIWNMHLQHGWSNAADALPSPAYRSGFGAVDQISGNHDWWNGNIGGLDRDVVSEWVEVMPQAIPVFSAGERDFVLFLGDSTWGQQGVRGRFRQTIHASGQMSRPHREGLERALAVARKSSKEAGRVVVPLLAVHHPVEEMQKGFDGWCAKQGIQVLMVGHSHVPSVRVHRGVNQCDAGSATQATTTVRCLVEHLFWVDPESGRAKWRPRLYEQTGEGPFNHVNPHLQLTLPPDLAGFDKTHVLV